MLLGDRRDIRAIYAPDNLGASGPMPVVDVHQSVQVLASTAESVSVTTGAGTVKLRFAPILSSLGDRVGKKGDTSLSFSGTLTTEVEWNDGLRTTNTLSAGQFAVHYETGLVKYNSGSTTTITATYKYAAPTGGVTSAAFTAYEAKTFTITGAQTNYDVATSESMFATSRTTVSVKTDIATTLKLNATGGGSILLAAGEQITIENFNITNLFITTSGTTVIRVVAFS